MIRLTPLAGEGRVLRVKDHVAFISDHDPDLVDALTSATDLFKTLAEYIVERSFEVTDLAVVAIEAKAAMLFGDVTLIAGRGQCHSAVRTTTWLEVDLSGQDLIVVQPGSTPPSLELDLKSGYVAAGGFVLALIPPDEIADRLREVLRRAEPKNDGAGDRPLAEAEEVDATARESEIAGEPEVSAEAEAPLPPRVCSPPVDDEISLSSEDSGLFDPLADPSGFDLERLGSEPSVAGPVPTQQPPAAGGQRSVGVEPGREAHEVEASSAAEQDLLAPAIAIPPPPPVPLPPPETGGETILPLPEPPPPMAPMSPRHGPASPPVNPPDTSPESVNVRFDDGQSVEVVAGLYVGRHPSKAGLPDGYDAVTIRGEQVSRRHWQLVVSEGRAVVSDLGSAAGTRVERSGGLKIDITGGTEVSPGDRIRFADRWADVESDKSG